MLNEVYEELKENFDSTIKDLKRDLAKIRTGRANLAIFDGITVDYYGTPTPLNQVGTMKVADPRLITITPWEKNMIPPIEKSIMVSDLGLNPTNDGAMIRVPIPQLTGDRRKDLVKQVKRSCEEHRVVARNYRREANDTIKMLEKEGEISEDQMHTARKKVQDLTDVTIKIIDELLEAKEKDVTDG